MTTKALTYRGNKNLVTLFPNIINEFPPHKVYWELFAGSAQILKRKKPAQLSCIVEINNNVGPYPSGTVVIYDDAISLLDDLVNLGKDHLIYLDPPYRESECYGGKAIYDYSLTDEQHDQLLKKLLLCRSNVVISHYDSSFYDERLIGWRKKVVNVSYHGHVKKEAIYMNFAPAEKLHESTFTGKNKTDRQRIKRKAERWVKRFLDLPGTERQLILTMLDQNKMLV